MIKFENLEAGLRLDFVGMLMRYLSIVLVYTIQLIERSNDQQETSVFHSTVNVLDGKSQLAVIL